MKSTAAKIIFIALIVIVGLGVLYVKNYGPETWTHTESKKKLEKFIKTQATIISQRSNGRIGKGQRTIWRIQFKDNQGKVQTQDMDNYTFMGKKNGENVDIYYNPENPNDVSSQDVYDQIMN